MLTAQIMNHFHIKKDWSNAGYYESERLRQLSSDISRAIYAGKLIAISGPVGSGKTVMINRLQDKIATSKKIVVARSLSIDKPRLALPALITALFLDIGSDLGMKIPTQPEKRERLLQDAICSTKKPVALFIDEAHDLHGHTLNGLKRLMEIIDAGGGILSVILVGHPKLHNDLKRSTMEEIGHRTTKFEFGSLGDERAKFLAWLLKECVEGKVKVDDIITADAREFLSDKLTTPLQFAEHLDRAFTDAYRLGTTTVTKDIVEETISTGFDDLDARLARIGYTPKTLSDQFDSRPVEMRRFLKGKLDPDRTQELGQAMRRAGLPV